MTKEEKWKYSSYVISLYLFVMFCIYPFYYENGYYNMGTAKCRFFLRVSVIAFFVLIITFIWDFIKQKIDCDIIFKTRNISITEKLLYAYMASVLVSYIFSDFKENVLWGVADWCMGTIPFLLISLLSVFIMHMWGEQDWLKVGILVVSAAVFVLGICHRFSFYPILLEPKLPEFISTLGNINWFCGYMSVISPIGVGIFVLKEDKEYGRWWKKWALCIYVWIVFITGFCQGSSSILLWNLALFFVLLLISLNHTRRIKKWLLTVVMWGMSGQLVRCFKTCFQEKYNYDSSLLIDTNATLIIAVMALFIYAIVCFYGKEDRELSVMLRKRICGILLAVLLIAILSVCGLAVYNTKVGVPYLMDHPLFLLNEKWGNGRGMIFKVSLEVWKEMSPLQKMFGVGADGFSEFAYSVPRICSDLQSYFGNGILTNAHCEILTNLINLGIVGTAVYISVFATFVARCLKRGATKPMAYIPAICVICYFANNLMSFAQALNFPYLFLILGLGECFLRKSEERK